jgi:hypothetical protein
MRDQDVVDMSTLNGIISIAHLVLAVYLSLQSCPAPEFAPLGLARKYEREVWAKMRHMWLCCTDRLASWLVLWGGVA